MAVLPTRGPRSDGLFLVRRKGPGSRAGSPRRARSPGELALRGGVQSIAYFSRPRTVDSGSFEVICACEPRTAVKLGDAVARGPTLSAPLPRAPLFAGEREQDCSWKTRLHLAGPSASAASRTLRVRSGEMSSLAAVHLRTFSSSRPAAAARAWARRRPLDRSDQPSAAGARQRGVLRQDFLVIALAGDRL